MIISRVKNRVREFLNTATSDTWLNFPEVFGITGNLGYGGVYSLHESFRCSTAEANGFEIFVSGVITEAKLTAELAFELVFALRPKPHPHQRFFSRQP